MPTVTIDERALTHDRTLAAGMTEASGRLRRVLIITPGQGSSGYYPAEVLERDGPRVIRAGTHVYLDHPGRTETQDRPERTVRDLAGVLESDAQWQEAGPDGPAGLYADMRPFAHIDPIISELAAHIGMSIRGGGEKDPDGTVTRLSHVESVDLVTRAGRGGKVLQLLESARPDGTPDPLVEARNVIQWFTARVHRDFTVVADDMAADGRLTRDERIALSNGIGDALTAFEATVADLAPHLYDRDPYDDIDTVPYIPTVTTQEAAVPNPDTETLTADLRARLAEAEQARDTAITERDAAAAERDEAVAARDRMVAEAAQAARRDTARDTVREALRHIQFATDAMRDDVVAGLTADVPVTEAGDVDTAALTERVAGRYPTPTGAAVTGLGVAAATPPPNVDGDLAEANQTAALAVFG